MSRFFLKRFEIEGLNCALVDVPLDRIPNGHVSNGHVSNGHVSNGHVSNGHVSNGHVSNGHAPNGHKINGNKVNGHQLAGHTLNNGSAKDRHCSDPSPAALNAGAFPGSHSAANSERALPNGTLSDRGAIQGNGVPYHRLSDVLRLISEQEERFRFEVADSASQLPKLSRLIWSKQPADATVLQGHHRYYELESKSDDFTKTEFRYTICDQFGQTVESDVDAVRPIFSDQSPKIESGYSVRIDLVAISLPRTGNSRLLARLASRDMSWIHDPNLILEL